MSIRSMVTVLALVGGLALTACEEKKEDTAGSGTTGTTGSTTETTGSTTGTTTDPAQTGGTTSN